MLRKKDTLFYPFFSPLPIGLTSSFLDPSAPAIPANLAGELGALTVATDTRGQPSEVSVGKVPYAAEIGFLCGSDKDGGCLPADMTRHTFWTPRVAPELILQKAVAPESQSQEVAMEPQREMGQACTKKTEEFLTIYLIQTLAACRGTPASQFFINQAALPSKVQ